MRFGIACILLSAATAAFSQDLPSYAAASANPKTVVDYFLLCPAISVDKDGSLLITSDSRISEKMFDAKKNFLAKGYSASDFNVGSVIVDVADAYIQFTAYFFMEEIKLTFVFFDRKGKTDIPAYSLSHLAPNSAEYEQGFFSIDKSGAWKDITADILPQVGLYDFDPTLHGLDLLWEYVLPRKGTTVLVTPRQTSDQVKAEGGPGYDTVDRLSKHPLELLWDRVNGRFTKGALE